MISAVVGTALVPNKVCALYVLDLDQELVIFLSAIAFSAFCSVFSSATTDQVIAMAVVYCGFAVDHDSQLWDRRMLQRVRG